VEYNARLTVQILDGDIFTFLCKNGDKITKSGGAVGYMENY
jgi:hypothetical protein|tara:strand:+ start:276 stop:398 length:123 start_codon:yes stop_codon:yes gene_type:complete